MIKFSTSLSDSSLF